MRIAHWTVINVSKKTKVDTSCHLCKMEALKNEMQKNSEDTFKIVCKVVKI